MSGLDAELCEYSLKASGLAASNIDLRSVRVLEGVTTFSSFRGRIHAPAWLNCNSVETFRDVPEICLQRLLSSFPDRWAGVALLLLRTVVAASAFIHAACTLNQPALTFAIWAPLIMCMVSSVFLILGLFTQMTCIILAVCAIATTVLHSVPCNDLLLKSFSSPVFAAVSWFAVLVLGPGMYSLDARMFGQREVIILPGGSSDVQK